MLTAIVALSLLALCFGLLLGYASIHFKVEGDPIVETIESLLPQTQCGQCGTPGCKAFAEALTKDEVEINGCPPGGEATMIALADLLGKDPIPMGEEVSAENIKTLAVIREDECIGCTLCIKACPVDAILGATKQMHTVISQECTGCELCVPPCPVDCIDMIPEAVSTNNWKWPYPDEPLPTLNMNDHAVET